MPALALWTILCGCVSYKDAVLTCVKTTISVTLNGHQNKNITLSTSIFQLERTFPQQNGMDAVCDAVCDAVYLIQNLLNSHFMCYQWLLSLGRGKLLHHVKEVKYDRNGIWK